MQLLVTFLFLVGLDLAQGHGDHGIAKGETVQQYARRHMAAEHHIEDFDLPSFFQLHDLDSKGFWEREEIEAVYGVHHVYSQKKSKDDIEHQKKADHIVNTVLSIMDKDGDGKISLQEFEAIGLDGLPNFDDLGAEGHHYDVESEFFLHHEEQFHSTPETQTDESYNHAEDLEHFKHHEHIERVEAEREAKFQGITVEEALKQHDPVPEQPPAPQGAPGQQPIVAGQQPVQHPHDDQQQPEAPVVNAPSVKSPGPSTDDPVKRFRDAKASAEEWGAGEDGYKIPRSSDDRMRKGLPYKYKFRRTWGDF